jgi:SAM-dependent methyltransferase
MIKPTKNNSREDWENQYRKEIYQDKIEGDAKVWHEFLDKVLSDENGMETYMGLEVACGLGVNACHIAGNYNVNLVATDFAEPIILENIKRYDDLNNLIFERLCLQTACERYSGRDIIFAFGILGHFDKPERPLRQIYNALKDGGRLVFSVPHLGSEHARMITHHSLWNYDNTIYRLQNAGFKKVVFYHNRFWDRHVMGVAYK